MKEYSVKRPLKRPPVHPGEVLREDVLLALRLSVSEAARRLGVSRQQLHRILACTHPITTDMALRIASLPETGQSYGCACSRHMICGMSSDECKATYRRSNQSLPLNPRPSKVILRFPKSEWRLKPEIQEFGRNWRHPVHPAAL